MVTPIQAWTLVSPTSAHFIERNVPGMHVLVTYTMRRNEIGMVSNGRMSKVVNEDVDAGAPKVALRFRCSVNPVAKMPFKFIAQLRLNTM